MHLKDIMIISDGNICDPKAKKWRKDNMDKFKLLTLIALIIYVISPIDAVPGPIDDVILCVAYAMVNGRR